MNRSREDRRRFLALAAAAVAAPAFATPTEKTATVMRTRKIPKSATGEAIPVIGMGTWSTFDVGDAASERKPLTEVLARFFAAGGRVIDSSPMYGRSESVTGDLVTAGSHDAWIATKVWTSGLAEGKAQIADSMKKLRTKTLDLLQVHNLVDWKTHLPEMRRMRDAGTVRHLGITHYSLGTFGEMEALLRKEKLDFVQLPYSVNVREAEKRLLPAAADTGTAVLVMRPFEEGSLFSKVKGKDVPAWATERGFTSWAQLFLSFILAHPAVTCAIPATSKPAHMEQNVSAGSGPELDAESKKKLIEALS